MIVHPFGFISGGGGEDPIVTDDLVLYLDAGKSSSYPGTAKFPLLK